ncbi:MAG: CPBP family intramembrane metalloprotease [Gemmatimonadota bacterium]|nr:hypothetical protein [Gemmatimonadota bacterium]MDP6528750.1 CPBP family intramembrane metalloprotease [Gemmatimonadota bacterium]MDP6803193.1 CPBP family intramembrane metalloprotease [Gemmatimonadota bacterium]MDP7031269.1 CPBP family intramembrane metalloprotease [Gemmatimonadota bacterium]
MTPDEPRDPIPGPEFFERVMFGARGLAFVVLAFLVPVVIREMVGVLLPGGGFAGLLRGDPGPPIVPVAVVAGSVGLSAAVVLAYNRLEKRGEGRAARQAGHRPFLRLSARWCREWVMGFAGGGGTALVVVGACAAAGGFRITGFSAPGTGVGGFLAVLAALALEAAREEMAFRGPGQRDLARAVNFPFAAVWLSGSFALIHLADPGSPGRMGTFGVFLAAMALAGLVHSRGDLAMACGAHAGWNAFVAQVCSVPVSGTPVAARLLAVEAGPSRLWNGGDFGPEGSLPGILVFGVFGWWIWKQAGRRARLPAPRNQDDTHAPRP